MKRVIWSLIVNVSIAAFVWFGFFQGIEGAQHVVKFYVWAMCFPLSFLLFTDKMQEGISKHPKIAFTEMLSRVVAWFSLGAFVWHGHIATAVAFGFWMVACAIAREGVKKHRAIAAETATQA